MGICFLEKKCLRISEISCLPSFKAKLFYPVWDGIPCIWFFREVTWSSVSMGEGNICSKSPTHSSRMATKMVEKWKLFRSRLISSFFVHILNFYNFFDPFVQILTVLTVMGTSIKKKAIKWMKWGTLDNCCERLAPRTWEHLFS